MNTLKHKIERTAFAKAFDVAYDKMGKDRQHEGRRNDHERGRRSRQIHRPICGGTGQKCIEDGGIELRI